MALFVAMITSDACVAQDVHHVLATFENNLAQIRDDVAVQEDFICCYDY
jgi:hypothetical protein